MTDEMNGPAEVDDDVLNLNDTDEDGFGLDDLDDVEAAMGGESMRYSNDMPSAATVRKAGKKPKRVASPKKKALSPPRTRVASRQRQWDNLFNVPDVSGEFDY